MSYATIDEVAALSAGRTFTATSKPTATQVGIFMRQCFAELNGIVAERGYTVPVATSATTSFQLLAAYNAMGAHCLVEKSAPTNRGDAAKEACEAWAAAKKALATGGVELPDASEAETGSSAVRAGYQATAMFTPTTAF